MAKISTETIDNLREFMNRGNGYSGTQEVIDDLVYETLRQLGLMYPSIDEIGLTDGYNEFATVGDFVNLFWDKAVEEILNVLETEE